MKKSVTMWIIQHPDKSLMWFYHVWATRKECIKNWESKEYPWKHWYKRGFRAVKVLVTQI